MPRNQLFYFALWSFAFLLFTADTQAQMNPTSTEIYPPPSPTVSPNKTISSATSENISQPNKSPSEQTIAEHSLSWLSRNNPLTLAETTESRDQKNEMSLQLSLLEVQSDSSTHYIFAISNTDQSRFVLLSAHSEGFSSRSLSDLGQIKSVKPVSSLDMTPKEIYTLYEKIDGLLKKGLEWDEFNSRLKKITESGSTNLKIEMVDFEILKKYHPIPSSILLNGSPEKIEEYTFKNFSYLTDQKHFGLIDYWQSIGEFVSNKKGDCEDFANLMHTLLKVNHISSFILNIYSSSVDHSIVVYKKGGALHVMDGTRKFRKAHAQTLSELIKKIAPRWKRAMIVEFSEKHHRGRILKEIPKTD